MSQGGGGDQTPISRLESQVEIGLGDSEATLSAHRQSLRDTQQETQRTGRAAGEMAQQIAGGAPSVKRLTDELKNELQVLAEIERLRESAGGQGASKALDDAAKQTQERIAALKTQVGDTSDEVVKSSAQMRQSFLGTVSSVQELEQHLVALKQVQQTGVEAGKVTPGLATEIKQTEAFIKSLDDTTRASARDMSQNFLATATSIDLIRQRLRALQEEQQRGFASGIRTPGLQDEINRTQRALKEIDGPLNQHGQNVGRMSVQYGIARSAVATMSAEIQRMGGVSIPGLSQLQGVTGGLAEKFIGLGGSGSVAAFGVIAVATAAATAGTVLTVLGAQVQEATAKIATTSNITVQAAHQQEEAFQGLRSGGVATADAYASVAGMLATYNGQALTNAQATMFMAAAQDGATATGQKLGQVTEGFARALIATRTPISQSSELMNILYITSLNTGVSIDQLGLSAARMVERTGAAAPSVRDLGIALTLAARAGAQGQQGLEPVDNLIRNLSNSSPKAERDLRGLGVTISKNAEGGLDLANTLLALKPAYEGLANDAQKYALAQELAGQGGPVLQSMLELTTDDIKKIIDAYDNHNRVSQDAQTHAQTLGGMFGQLTTQAKDAAGGVGNQLAGAFEQAGEDADHFGTIVHNLVDGLRDYNRERGIAAGHTQAEFTIGGAPQLQLNVEREEEAAIAARREARSAREAADALAARTAAATTQEQERPGFDITSLQHQQELLSSLGTEAARLHEAMVAVTDPKITPGGEDQEHAVNTYLAALTQVEAGIRRAYDPAKPQEMNERLARLNTLTDQYKEAVDSLAKTNSDADRTRAQGIQGQIDLLNIQINGQDIKHQQDQQDAAFTKQQSAEQERAARAAREADPLLGISQGLAKSREELIGTAGQVMGDLNKTIELKGQEGARAAGEAFATEARKWGEELEKAGVENWEDSFNRLVDLGREAIVTKSPEVTAAIHDLLAGGEEEVKDSNIGRAMADAMAKANAQMLDQQTKIDADLLRAQTTGADARAQALQTEVDREYDVWAGRQIEKLETADRNGRELLRIGEEWGREDVDRAEQRSRARADQEENANRAARDRAQSQGRALTDLADQQGRAQGDLTRQRAREDTDAQYEHEKRLKEIQKRGGDPVQMSKAIADENASYQQAIDDRTRKRGEDNVETAIKQAQQVADAQKRQAEQVSDANRKAVEQAGDLARRQGEEDTDLTKTRTRQLQQRKDQQTDQDYLRDQRLAHEQQYHTDAETKANERLQNELTRINARIEHEVAKDAAASEQMGLKRQHDLDIAAIKADENQKRITPEESTRRQGDVELAFIQQTNDINRRLAGRDREIDRAMEQDIARRRQYAPGFAPQNVPFEATREYVPPTPSFGKGAFGAGADSLFSSFQNEAKTFQLQFLGQQPSSEPMPVILPDQQIQQIIDGVGNLPPMEMDGAVVESSTSRIRRNQNRARALG